MFEEWPSGDPRRCPAHPGVRTSSPDGLHDGLCGLCEYAAEMDEEPDQGPELPRISPLPTFPVLDDQDIPF